MKKTPTKSYAEKLRDPRWQKMRLEIMERDKFTCRNCGDKKKTLNVHHHFYTKGAAPWEYGPESLSTLCEDCHAKAEVGNEEIRKKTGDGSLMQIVTLNFLKCAGASYPFNRLAFPRAVKEFNMLVCNIGRARKALDARDREGKESHLNEARSSLLNFIQYASESISELEHHYTDYNEEEEA